MKKRKWFLLIFFILLLLGYFKFFYKTYSETVVARNADYIFAIDVKRVTNTIIWQTITTPSRWNKISFSRGGGVDWKDMFKLPDYVFIFHTGGQPAPAWYGVLEIKKEKGFNEGLQQYHFKSIKDSAGLQLYHSEAWKIDMVRHGSKVLLGNGSVEDKDLIVQTAAGIFLRKRFIEERSLQKNIAAGSHLSLQIKAGEFLQEDAVIKLNFDKDKISLDGSLLPRSQYVLTDNTFTYDPHSLATLAFTQPGKQVYDLLPDSTRSKAGLLLGFDIDSLLLPGNSYYKLHVKDINSRIDTAISYTYDNDFNPVEKKVIEKILEPSFQFTVKGQPDPIYNNWKHNEKLEQVAGGELFLPMPFVRSYCTKTREELMVTSVNFSASETAASSSCILFFRLMLSRIPSSLQKYLPAYTGMFSNMESVQLILRKDGNELKLAADLQKEKNDLPILGW